MGGNLEKKTVLRIADCERPSVVSLSNVVGGFHNSISLRTGPVMAGQAIGPKDGEYLLLKIDRFVSLSLRRSRVSPMKQGEENQKVKKIDLREVIMGKSAWFSAGGENVNSIEWLSLRFRFLYRKLASRVQLCFPTEACV